MIYEGSLEIWFTDGLVGMIQVSFERGLVNGRPSLPSTVGVEVPFGVIKRTEFCQHLDRHGIRWKPETRLPESLNVRLAENFCVGFDDYDGRIMEITVAK